MNGCFLWSEFELINISIWISLWNWHMVTVKYNRNIHYQLSNKMMCCNWLGNQYNIESQSKKENSELYRLCIFQGCKKYMYAYVETEWNKEEEYKVIWNAKVIRLWQGWSRIPSLTDAFKIQKVEIALYLILISYVKNRISCSLILWWSIKLIWGSSPKSTRRRAVARTSHHCSKTALYNMASC